MHKNAKLFFLLVILITLGSLIQSDPFEGQRNNFDVELFSIENFAEVFAISFTEGQNTRRVEKSHSGVWTLNGQHVLDSDIQNSLFGVLNRIRVSRQFEKLPIETDKAVKVKIEWTNKGPQQIEVFGDPSTQRTYFGSGGKFYQVHIPGHLDYLAPIFALTTLQLKDRTVFSSDWNTLRSIKLYDNDSLILDIVNGIAPQVLGINELDSNKLFSYLDQFLEFKINEWVDDRILDGHPEFEPSNAIYKIKLEDLGETTLLNVHEVSSFPKLYFVEINGVFGVVEKTRLSSLIRASQYFDKSYAEGIH